MLAELNHSLRHAASLPDFVGFAPISVGKRRVSDARKRSFGHVDR